MDWSGSTRARAWLSRHEVPVVATIATLALGVAIWLVMLMFQGTAASRDGAGPTESAFSAPVESDANESTQPTQAPDSLPRTAGASASASPIRSGPWASPSLDFNALLTLNEWTMTQGAEVDDAQASAPSGTLAAPAAAAGAAVFDEPEGDVMGLLPHELMPGQAAAYPVIAERGDWLQVLLPTRRGLPSVAGADGVNGATGWVLRSDTTVSESKERITISLSARTVTLQRDGQVVLEAAAQVGDADAPTPATRTFVTGTYSKPSVTFSNLSIGLGAHSAVLDSYRSTPATLAIHALTLGSRPVPDSCIRVDLQTLDTLSHVAPGTPVLIAP